MNPTESQTNEPPPVSAVRFRPEPPSQNAEDREKREKDHDADWKDGLVLPLARFMQQREMKAISITVDAGIAGFELTPKGEAVLIYELVDATDEERYYPMGLLCGRLKVIVKAQHLKRCGRAETSRLVSALRRVAHTCPAGVAVKCYTIQSDKARATLGVLPLNPTPTSNP